jgi:CubicO group peptidase (beta-lactamase class C family)
MVYGVAKERGEMPNIDSAVVDYFDRGDVAALDARKRRLTVRDLLTMRAGLDWDESSVAYTDPRNNCAVMEASPDWAAYAIGRPMAAEPGDTFVYNSGATVLLAHVFRRSTGQDLGEYAARHLFEPLGITDFYWKRTPTGLPDAEGGLYLLPRDLAKLGLLYLRGGRWRDRQLVPADWVAASTAPVPTGGEYQYGLQWWLIPYPDGTGRFAWAGLGYGGQRLLVLPEEEIVAVFTGWNIDEHPPLSATEMVGRLLAAVAP